jgi:hypothetical protein
MKQRRGLWITVVVAIAVLSWWLALVRPAREDETLAAQTDVPPAPVAPPPAPARPPSAPEPEPPSELEPEPEPPPVAAAVRAPEPTDSIEPIPPDTRGFIEALESRFENDPRDSGATEVETQLRRMFRGPRMPASLLKAVLCRESVCKLDVSWHPLHDPMYRHVMAQLTGDNAKFVATRAGPVDDRGAIPVEVYWLRAKPNLPE